ncbi:ABC transporter substrate-binding protein [Spelaeicoccus albus]|uniref:Iron complex transport system substrate-binding protein n=1 Tax=Spelaeicoccus albus TaxID=1280376 RepID=A0A7Z0D1J4_9MICO|nr:ABC transporter substrate-binding protein [Spelaeicoccus albus]NYI66190.1 iron complex transport system substrate-binding protein [Spelaeicoccus albus]
MNRNSVRPAAAARIVARHAVTRRGALALAASAIGGATLAGCGQSSKHGKNSGASTSSSGAFPLTMSDDRGTVTIKKEPKRIAALGYGDQDTLVALGIYPVMANQWVPAWKHGLGVWAEKKVPKDKLPAPMNMAEPSFEGILKTAPDLITAANVELSDSQYSRLSKIATVVGNPKGMKAYAIPWEVQATQVGTAVGKKAETKKLIGTVKDDLADLVDKYPALKGKEGIVMVLDNGQYGVYASTDTRGKLLSAMGIGTPKRIDALMHGKFYASISKEQVAKLDTDVLIVLNKKSEVASDPGFSDLPVVRRGSVVYVGNENDALAFSASTLLSIPYVSGRLVPRIAAAAAKV